MCLFVTAMKNLCKHGQVKAFGKIPTWLLQQRLFFHWDPKSSEDPVLLGSSCPPACAEGSSPIPKAKRWGEERQNWNKEEMEGNRQRDLHPPELLAFQGWEWDPGSWVSPSGGCQEVLWDPTVPSWTLQVLQLRAQRGFSWVHSPPAGIAAGSAPHSGNQVPKWAANV